MGVVADDVVDHVAFESVLVVQQGGGIWRVDVDLISYLFAFVEVVPLLDLHSVSLALLGRNGDLDVFGLVVRFVSIGNGLEFALYVGVVDCVLGVLVIGKVPLFISGPPQSSQPCRSRLSGRPAAGCGRSRTRSCRNCGIYRAIRRPAGRR